MKKTTLDDIARAAHCSTYTVSLALRGLPGVSAATARNVRRAARKLGYQGNAPAAMLAMQRNRRRDDQRTIPVACVGVTDNRGIVWEAFSAECAALGLAASRVVQGEYATPKRALDVLWQRGVRGLFLLPITLGWREDEIVEAGWERFSVVKETRGRPELPFHVIRFSAFDHMIETLRRVFHMGYRRVGVLLLPSLSAQDDLARVGAVAGYREALLPPGGALDLMLMDSPEPDPANLLAVRGWLRKFEPDALVMFPWALYRLYEAVGGTVPGPVGVASPLVFRGLANLADFSGCLSQDGVVGMRAAQRLFKMIQANECGPTASVIEEVIEPVWSDGATLPWKARGS